MDVFQKQIDLLQHGSIGWPIGSLCLLFSCIPNSSWHQLIPRMCYRQLKFPDLTVKLIGSSVRFRNTTDAGQSLNHAKSLLEFRVILYDDCCLFVYCLRWLILNCMLCIHTHINKRSNI